MTTDNPERLLKWGLGGAFFAALCCFTPLLVVVIAGLGLSAFTGWLDYALFPLMFFSLAVVAQALWLRAGRPGPNPKLWATALATVLSVLIIWLEFRFALRITIGAFLAIGLYAIFSIERNPKEQHNDDGMLHGPRHVLRNAWCVDTADCHRRDPISGPCQAARPRSAGGALT